MSEAFSNYFNYFTEIEDRFQQARGTGLFLLSPLDWALIEAWKNSAIPLEAVLRGIDAAFEKWKTKRSRFQQVNSLAYCSQAVMVETQRMADAGSTGQTPEPAPFDGEQIEAFLADNAAAIRNTAKPEFEAIAVSLDNLRGNLAAESADLEALEQKLTVLEEKMVAIARASQPEEQALQVRRELETYLRPYKGKMTASQIAMLEARFLDRNLLETTHLPRLSLFYLHQ